MSQSPDLSDSPSPPPMTPAAGMPPPEPSYRQRFVRWFGLGLVRLTYRYWTRIATRLFPEGSPQAGFVERIGIPLPDRLDYTWIQPNLAVGGRIRPSDIPRLAKAGITRVVDVRSEHRDDEVALHAHGITLLYLPTPDTYPLTLEDLQRGADWINAQLAEGAKVLVHCEHGVGRSVLLTAAALLRQGMTPNAAFTLIADRRWQASPNKRQVERLNDFARAGAAAQV